MKLDGVRVLDLSAFLPGPHMTMIMADHGAEVIMVEPDNGVGEPARALGIRASDDVSVWFRNIARGKKSIRINLKDPDERAAFYRLVETADVVVEAFRPGVVARLGVDYGTLKKINARLVYCSISAFGQTGPLRDKPAHDLVIQALAGTLALGVDGDGKPVLPNLVASDAISSLMALSGILMALLRREQTGAGDYIDMSMLDGLMAWTPNITGPVFGHGKAPEPKTMRNYGGAAMNNVYETKDGAHLVIGGSELKFTTNLLTALNRPDLIDIAAGEPGQHQEPVIAFFRHTFRTKTLAEWNDVLNAIDVCWAPVRTLKDVFDDPHTAERAMALQDKTGQSHIGVPIKFKDEPGAPNLSLAEYGEHTGDYLKS